MRTLIIAGVVIAVLVAAIAAGYQPAMQYWEKQSAPKWRTADVVSGDIISVVNSSGTVKPVLEVSVGSFVSGPIDAEYELKDRDGKPLLDQSGQPLHIAAFNQEVRRGDQLAKIDPRIYRAQVARDTATLATANAEVERVKAVLQQAINDEKRAYALREEDATFIAQADLDKVRFHRMSVEAQLKVAETSIDQAEAQLELTVANLNYTDIVSPVDGIVINRKIEPGQTLAAQFQTPELFVVAPDMRKRMFIHASVDEADIGLINSAKQKRLPVTFTVDAYPDDLFTGAIEEIRLSSTTTQNVVTYPVVVAAPNPDLKLLPGMTASMSFEVERRMDVVKIPNSALRFFPLAQHVREEDKPLLEGKDTKKQDDQQQETNLSAEERAHARQKRTRRHVWVQEGPKLRAVEVHTGLSDSQFTELMRGSLKAGDKLVIGIETQPSSWGG
jgi:HlyD family secretion protein